MCKKQIRSRKAFEKIIEEIVQVNNIRHLMALPSHAFLIACVGDTIFDKMDNDFKERMEAYYARKAAKEDDNVD